MTVATIYYIVLSLIKFQIWGPKTFFQLSVDWSKFLLKVSRVKVEIITNPPSNKEAYIYVSNHCSMYDIPIVLTSVLDNTRIMYKEELEKIPIWGYGLRKSPFIAIQREDPRNAAQSLEKAVESMREGESVLVFPEGTRSLDGNVAPFKRGAFHLAAKSGKKIVPITIIGSNKILVKGSLKFNAGIVKIIFDDPIDLGENVNKQVEVAAMSKIAEIMKENLEKYSS